MTYSADCIATKIDSDWDTLLEATPRADLTQSTLWAASRQKIGFRSYHVSVRDERGALVGGAIVYVKQFAPGVCAGSIPRGPVVFGSDRRAAPAVLRHTVDFMRRSGIGFLVAQPPEGANEIERAMAALGFRTGAPSVAPDATTRINLRRRNDEILKAMAPNRRRDIRDGMGANYAIRQERDPALFHRLHLATAARQKFDAMTLSDTTAQWEFLASAGHCTMFIARHDNQPVAGIWLTRFGDAVTYKRPGWNPDISAPHVNEALHWTAIQWARQSGAHTYDFGGMDRTNAELLLAGLPTKDGFNRTPYFFKQRFGGTPVVFPRARFIFTNRISHYFLARLVQQPIVARQLRRVGNLARSGRLGK